jgi:DNA-binding NtrC family response regulator
VDVRIVAATNRNLRALVNGGAFREDLFYRLNVFPLTVPPLRERRSDIPMLIEHALGRLQRRVNRQGTLACSPFAMRVLIAYDWPGNVRQLFSVLESAAIHADGERIEVNHLPADVRGAAEGTPVLPRYRASPEDDERAAIVAALERSGGVLSQSADLLGMGRTTLWRKLKAYGLDTGRLEEPPTSPPKTT